MSRTVSRAKKHSIEELRTILRGTTWEHVLGKKRTVYSFSRQNVRFYPRYGTFMCRTWLMILAEGQCVCMIEAKCPIRGDSLFVPIHKKEPPVTVDFSKPSTAYQIGEADFIRPHRDAQFPLKGRDGRAFKSTDPVLRGDHAN